MKTVFVIPARGGSKGLPGKNIKELGGRPLLLYSLGFARLFSGDEDICVSTDDTSIAAVLESSGYRVPFMRPTPLSTDQAGMREVLIHALDFYEKKNGRYDKLILLQPTSPFRKREFLEEAMSLYSDKIDMVVSVNESKANPYFNLFEEDRQGYLKLSKQSNFFTRQEAPRVYQYNGNFYIINANSLRAYSSLSEFPKIIKYTIPFEYATDIDNMTDWNTAEFLINNFIALPDGKL